MRALTLTEPYATLVAYGQKRIETRSWRTDYRGTIAIHSATTLAGVGGLRRFQEQLRSRDIADALRDCRTDARLRAFADFPSGCLVAVADLVAVVTTAYVRHERDGIMLLDGFGRPHYWTLSARERALGDYSSGRYAWLLANVRRLRTPVRARGHQALWIIPAKETEEIHASIRE